MKTETQTRASVFSVSICLFDRPTLERLSGWYWHTIYSIYSGFVPVFFMLEQIYGVCCPKKICVFSYKIIFSVSEGFCRCQAAEEDSTLRIELPTCPVSGDNSDGLTPDFCASCYHRGGSRGFIMVWRIVCREPPCYVRSYVFVNLLCYDFPATSS